MSSGKMLTCPTCGNEEPEGSRFCGNCSAPLEPADQQPAPTTSTEASAPLRRCNECGAHADLDAVFCGECGAALASEAPPPQPAVEQPSPVEPRPTSPPRGKRRLRWVAAGAAVALLVAGGAVAAVLSLTGGDGSTEVVTTEQQTLSGATSETLPPASNPTLADSIAPNLEELAASQSALGAHVRSLEAGTESLAEVRDTADALAASVVRTQAFLDGLAPNDSTEAATLSLLRLALASHLAYAETIASLPSRPRSFTRAMAQAAIDRAEEVRRAYVELAVADPALPIIYISSSEHVSLLAVVPSPKPTRRVIDLVPLLVGIGPDDPLGEGRCFGPYGGGSLRVSGVVYRSGFIQCGDDADGDPSRASGVYRFSGLTFPAGSRLVRLTGQAVIDEFSSPSQRGSSVTWTVFYDGTPICSETVVWSGSRPLPRDLDCRLPSAVASSGFDVRRLQIQQVASLASTGDFWAGLLNPTTVVEVPS